MLIPKFNPYHSTLPRADVTPEAVFENRREFIRRLGALGLVGVAAPSLTGAFCAPPAIDDPSLLQPPFERPGSFPAKRNDQFAVPNTIDRKELTARETAAAHNNFYEFLPGRGGPVWEHVGDYRVEPWKIEIKGECAKPQTLDLDDLFEFDQEERIYHFRCVERWAMNVPWTGFPLASLLEKVEPTAKAKYVRFVSANRPAEMPGVEEAAYYPWPYQEALRLDEAMNELVLVATGIYGHPLLKQHGAPVRLVVPWKYGYKNPKAIVEIELVKDQPKTFWQIQPHEYGFISNINPNIPHPRWSQAVSYWLDNRDDFPTPMFNGYEEYVAELYPDEPRSTQEPLGPGQVAR